jgi:hypothetical protein
MRTFRFLLIGLCLVALNGCYYNRPFLAYRYRGGCCPTPCCPPPHCSCYLGAPTPIVAEPPTMFVAPMPKQ